MHASFVPHLSPFAWHFKTSNAFLKPQAILSLVRAIEKLSMPKVRFVKWFKHAKAIVLGFN